jgi:hypothetical protein
MANIETLARRAGYRIRRGRTDPARLWLIDPHGRLLTPLGGTDVQGIRDLLDVAESRPRAAPDLRR